MEHEPWARSGVDSAMPLASVWLALVRFMAVRSLPLHGSLDGAKLCAIMRDFLIKTIDEQCVAKRGVFLSSPPECAAMQYEYGAKGAMRKQRSDPQVKFAMSNDRRTSCHQSAFTRPVCSLLKARPVLDASFARHKMVGVVSDKAHFGDSDFLGTFASVPLTGNMAYGVSLPPVQMQALHMCEDDLTIEGRLTLWKEL